MIDWMKISREEARQIAAIAQRAIRLAAKHGVRYEFMDADMDLTACHLNGCALKLDELATAPEFDFAHDVFGIRRHIDRETGKLQDCFVPRYAA